MNFEQRERKMIDEYRKREIDSPKERERNDR